MPHLAVYRQPDLQASPGRNPRHDDGDDDDDDDEDEDEDDNGNPKVADVRPCRTAFRKNYAMLAVVFGAGFAFEMCVPRAPPSSRAGQAARMQVQWVDTVVGASTRP